ncbi:MAG: hypothetical protein F4153_03175 [Acidimicrobiia bacterium]|nr:hypothetical protein [Acidimicrobiia bacterium]
MGRRSTATMGEEAVAALADALSGLGLGVLAEFSASGKRADLILEPAGIELDVKAKPVITAGNGAEIARQDWTDGFTRVWVAERIAAEAKKTFREQGINFFDLRGEIRIVERPLFIDTKIDVEEPYPPARSGPLDSQVAKEIAIACLLTPDQPHGVRETARLIGRSPGAVSTAMANLERVGLLTSRAEPLIPDLFHELAIVWRRRPLALAKMPEPETGRLSFDAESSPDGMPSKWTLTDTVAAQSWGIPVVAPGGYPPDFYVPDRTVLHLARRRLGEPESPERRACTVAVAPVRFACRYRFDHSNTSGVKWPVANHIVVALDLAQDKARGMEMVDQWHPKGIVRAW